MFGIELYIYMILLCMIFLALPIELVVRKRTLSPARHVLEDTSHQIRPKIDAGDASLLMGSIN
jgi:hypothetical protein